MVGGEDCSCVDIIELACPCTVGGLCESNRSDGSKGHSVIACAGGDFIQCPEFKAGVTGRLYYM